MRVLLGRAATGASIQCSLPLPTFPLQPQLSKSKIKKPLTLIFYLSSVPKHNPFSSLYPYGESAETHFYNNTLLRFLSSDDLKKKMPRQFSTALFLLPPPFRHVYNDGENEARKNKMSIYIFPLVKPLLCQLFASSLSFKTNIYNNNKR